MKQIDYPQLGETLYQETLANGLRVYLLPKAGYHRTYAVMTTEYGSIDNDFVPYGQSEMVSLPAGIAHFLEHKMFEKADHDAFDTFAHFGASSNAFTSFTHTSYLFSTTRNLKENLETLLDFVQDPYFTDKTVNKEKGIIGQEIQMYEDDPNSRAYFGTIANLYPDQPLANDIAGTIDSIDKITPEDLYLAHKTFYHPSNMSLFIVGKVTPEETMQWVRDNQAQKDFGEPQPIKRQSLVPLRDGSDIVRRRTLTMPVERPKVTIGIRGLDELPTGRDRLKFEDALSIGMELLIGDTAPDFLRLYDQGVIDDSFGYNIEVQRGAHFVVLAGETEDPAAFETELLAILAQAKDKLKGTQETFDLAKREEFGSTITAFNSLEAIANQFDDQLYAPSNLFDEAAIIDELTLDDVIAALDQFLKPEAISVQRIVAPEAG